MGDFNSLNVVILVGNLGEDPKLYKGKKSKQKFTRFSLCTNQKAINSKKIIEQWHKVVAWGSLAEAAVTYLRKGSSIMIKGYLKTRTYNKDGEKRYITEVHANEWIFNSKGKSGDVTDNTEPPEEEEGYSAEDEDPY